MGDYHVFITGRAPGASGLALNDERREFIVREVATAVEAERAALRAAKGAGVERAICTGVFPYHGGEMIYPVVR